MGYYIKTFCSVPCKIILNDMNLISLWSKIKELQCQQIGFKNYFTFFKKETFAILYIFAILYLYLSNFSMNKVTQNCVKIPFLNQ